MFAVLNYEKANFQYKKTNYKSFSFVLSLFSHYSKNNTVYDVFLFCIYKRKSIRYWLGILNYYGLNIQITLHINLKTKIPYTKIFDLPFKNQL